MRTGAHDYMIKGNLTRLAHLAYHDPLTDLPNRTLMLDRLRQAILGARRGAAG